MSVPHEHLLRSSVEFVPAGIALLASFLFILFPDIFLMPEHLAYIFSLFCIILGFYRFRQGMTVVRYRKGLRRVPDYKDASTKVRFSRHKLFLGKGFAWSQVHAQRLYDTTLPQNTHFLKPGFLFKMARNLEIKLEGNKVLGFIPKITSKYHFLNPVCPLPPVGGKPEIHGVGAFDEKNLYSDLSERGGHTLVMGTTGVGKTRLEEGLVTQDIHRGDIVIVFDPKGDKELLFRMYAEAKRAGRANSFYMFHLGHPKYSAKYNAVGNFSRITEVASRVSGQLSAEGNSAAFKEFAWRFTNIIALALVALGQKPSYETIARYVRNIEPLLVEYYEWWIDKTGTSNWRDVVKMEENSIDPKNLPLSLRDRGHHAIAIVRYIKKNDIYDPVGDGLRSAFEYDKTYFDKIVASLLPLLEKLTTGEISALLSPDYSDLNDNRPVIDWLQIIRQKGIVYVGLDALSDGEVGGAVGNSMFADLTSVAGQIYKFGRTAGLPDVGKLSADVPVNLHADEFNELIGDEFIPMLNKSRGAGFQVTAYTQTFPDIEARLGSKAKAEQAGGNLNTLIMMRVKHLETAQILTDQLPEIKLVTKTAVSGVTDVADSSSEVEFNSRNEDRITDEKAPLLRPSDVMQLPKGQAFALINGGKLMKLRIPLPYDGADVLMPTSIKEIADELYQ
jgi:conjugative coupling factor TraD (TOL family)